jgi:hypothetical protein
VVRFSRARKRYERQGILVEEAALERAEDECLADEDARARQRLRAAERRKVEDVGFQARFAREIRNLFPGCPVVRAEAIALHAAARGSPPEVCGPWRPRAGRSDDGGAMDGPKVRSSVTGPRTVSSWAKI